MILITNVDIKDVYYTDQYDQMFWGFLLLKLLSEHWFENVGICF